MCQRDKYVRGWCVLRAPVSGCWCLEDDEPGFRTIVMRMRRDDTDTDEGSCSGEVDITQHVQLQPTECTPGKQPHVTFEQDEVKDRREHPEMPAIQIS